MSKLQKITAANMHRSWLNVPRVTQFDDADITELEKFRKQLNEENKKEGTRVTVLAFLMKALVSALKEFPRFNSSLDHTGENLILKQYVNIGVAMDTPDGLVVPVIRDCDRKSLIELAQELEAVALNDPYFIDHNLYPNVDFYSGIVLRAIGIPTNMFTVMFAIGRLPGWIAQWKEMIEDPHQKIGRPRQLYTGETHRDYVPISSRS